MQMITADVDKYLIGGRKALLFRYCANFWSFETIGSYIFYVKTDFRTTMLVWDMTDVVFFSVFIHPHKQTQSTQICIFWFRLIMYIQSISTYFILFIYFFIFFILFIYYFILFIFLLRINSCIYIISVATLTEIFILPANHSRNGAW